MRLKACSLPSLLMTYTACGPRNGFVFVLPGAGPITGVAFSALGHNQCDIFCLGVPSTGRSLCQNTLPVSESMAKILSEAPATRTSSRKPLGVIRLRVTSGTVSPFSSLAWFSSFRLQSNFRFLTLSLFRSVSDLAHPVRCGSPLKVDQPEG